MFSFTSGHGLVITIFGDICDESTDVTMVNMSQEILMVRLFRVMIVKYLYETQFHAVNKSWKGKLLL